MSKRRPLHFDSLADVRHEAESLLRDGYDRAGNWSLGRICHHLSNGLNYSRDGFPQMKPWILRQIGHSFFLPGILKRKVVRVRFPAPIPTDYDGTDEEGVQLLMDGIDRFQRPNGVHCEHTILGKMNGDQWLQFHLWHCEHHFSFLIPSTGHHLQTQSQLDA